MDLSDDTPAILRPGMISQEQIEAVLQQKLVSDKKNKPRVSGALKSHYAPRTKTRVLSRAELELFWGTAKGSFAIVAHSNFDFLPSEDRHFIKLSNDPQKYAQEIYRVLRELDNKNLQQIVVESVPNTEGWGAIHDRLDRATS